MTGIILNAQDLRKSLPIALCIDAMATAMQSISDDTMTMADRSVIPLKSGGGFLGTMPGSLGTGSLGTGSTAADGIKIMTIRPHNPQAGHPMLQGVMVLFDPDTGAFSGLIDATELTLLRTAAASGLATRLLARNDTKTLSIFGYGAQAAPHIDAILAVRDISDIIIWGRSPEKGQAFADKETERLGKTVRFTTNAQDAAAAADIICTVTSATDPVIRGDWVKPGTHLNLIGSHDAKHREVDSALIASSIVFVDRLQSALVSAGDVVAAVLDGSISADHLRGEIGQLIKGDVKGRSDQHQITVFKSIGIVAQDLVAASVALENARTLNIGKVCGL